MSTDEVHAHNPARRIGETVLSVENISLAFGGVKALTDISFDVREHEIRAIIGPQRRRQELHAELHQRRIPAAAGRPSASTVRTSSSMDPHKAASMGIARTFQNIALFKGMSGARQHQ